MDRRWALTAGHCVDGEDSAVLPAGSFTVVVARHSRNSGGTTLAVEGPPVRHPAWEEGTASHDVALLHLAEDAGVDPVEIASPDSRDSWDPDSLVELLGWGSTETLTGFLGGQLSEAEKEEKARANRSDQLLLAHLRIQGRCLVREQRRRAIFVRDLALHTWWGRFAVSG